MHRPPISIAAVLVAALCALSACVSRSPAPVVDRSPPPRVANPLPVYTPPPVVTPAAPALPELHTAQANETLGNVALRYNLDYRNLVAINPQISNPQAPLVSGQMVRLQSTAPIVGGVVPLPPTSTRDTERPKPAVQEPSPPVVPQDGLVREPKAVKLPYSDRTFAELSGRPAPNVVGNSVPISAPMPAQTPAPAVSSNQRPGAPSTAAPAIAVAPPVAAPPVVAAPIAAPTSAAPATAATVKLPEEGDIKDWAWPVEGRNKITANFNESAAMKGVDIAGKTGQSILAAAAGRVIFAGPFRGYGNMVIIKHNNTFNSVYAHNAKILVSEGQAVSKGMKIAEMGASDADSTKLHFEIRRSGKSVDPSKLLPQN